MMTQEEYERELEHLGGQAEMQTNRPAKKRKQCPLLGGDWCLGKACGWSCERDGVLICGVALGHLCELSHSKAF